jgi:hypothetical protein
MAFNVPPEKKEKKEKKKKKEGEKSEKPQPPKRNPRFAGCLQYGGYLPRLPYALIPFQS